MTTRLSKSASGRSHLRWVRTVLSRIDAHQKYNFLLTGEQKDALTDERTTLQPFVAALNAAVTPYRAFIEDAYTEARAAQAVADYLCDEGQRQADGQVKPRRKELDALFRAQGGFSAIFSHRPLSRVLRAGRETTEAMARMAGMLLASIPATIVDTSAVSSHLLQAADLLKGFLDQEKDTIDPQRAPLRIAVNSAVYALREALEKMDGRLRSHFSEPFIESLYPLLKKGGTEIDEGGDEDEGGGGTDA